MVRLPCLRSLEMQVMSVTKHISLRSSALMKQSRRAFSWSAEKPGCGFASNPPWHTPCWPLRTSHPRLPQRRHKDLFLGRTREGRTAALYPPSTAASYELSAGPTMGLNKNISQKHQDGQCHSSTLLRR